jgi:signal transduction histidine kinase
MRLLELNPKQHKYTNNIIVSGHHLLDMVNDILDLSKIEAGKISLSPDWVELHPLMYSVMDMLDDLAYRQNIHMGFEIAPRVDGIYADPARLRQILLNLISNAVKFNRENGRVSVRVFSQPEYDGVVFQVEDTGIGIPKKHLEHLFTEFYQVDYTSTRRQDGTGLGLALTRRLVELHGGDISIESEEGVGTVVTFRLPQRFILPAGSNHTLFQPQLSKT